MKAPSATLCAQNAAEAALCTFKMMRELHLYHDGSQQLIQQYLDVHSADYWCVGNEMIIHMVL
jgi:hypothetical protein